MALSGLEQRQQPLGNTFLNVDEHALLTVGDGHVLIRPSPRPLNAIEHGSIPELKRSSSFSGFMSVKHINMRQAIAAMMPMQNVQAKRECTWRGPGVHESMVRRGHADTGLPSAASPNNNGVDGLEANSMPVTTLMIRNLPKITQRELLLQLDSSGFKDTYDFAYMPCLFSTGSGKGYAFVNFVQAGHARMFENSWDKARLFDIAQWEPSLSVTSADIQGLEANVAKWSTPRMNRIRNPNLKPFIAHHS